MRNIRYALRSLRRQPAFALLAVIAMALGIGANTAVFSVVYAVLLKALPYARPDEIVFITEVQSGTANSVNVPPANYFDYRGASSLQSIGAAEAWGATLTGFAAPEQVRGLRVTASIFDVVGVPSALGRTFRPEDEQPGNDRVIVLSHPFWVRRFGGDTSVVGRTIALNGEPWKVVGVMPRDFHFAPFWATNAQMFAPLSFDENTRASRGLRTLRVFARLRPGATAASAAGELKAVFARAVEASPDNNARLEPVVVPLNDMVVGKVRTALIVLLVAVGLVLLIACANVATLILVRTMGRRRDIAVRLSLGAGRLHLLMSALAETAILAVAGGALGLLLASTGIDALSTWFSASMPRDREIAINTEVLMFTGGVSVFAALLLSLVPAFQVSVLPVYEALKESSRSVGGSVWTNRVRRGLVIAQVAFSLVLLLGAGLLIRSLVALQAVDPGFRPAGVLTAVVHTWGTSASEANAQLAFYRTVRERLRTLPGVESVALINHLPLAGDMWGVTVQPEDKPVPAPGEEVRAVYRLATDGYFPAMGIPLLRGRAFSKADVKGTLPVAVINDAMARQAWAGEDPIGKRLRLGGDGDAMTVIGVVRDVVQQDWISPRKPEVYIPLEQHPEAIGRPHTSSMTIVVRTSGETPALRNALVQEVAAVNNTVPVTELQTLDEVVANATQRARVYASLLAIFAISALALASIGLYGLVAYDAGRRTREMGVRIALGARPSDVTALVLRDAMSMVAAGGLIGLACSFAASRWLASMLYGVTPTDALTICGVTVLFTAISCAAAYLPARRVARIDPMHALTTD